MRLTIIPAILCVISSVAHAIPLAAPVASGEFELIDTVRSMFQERFFDDELQDFHNLIQKRDTTLTIETLLDLFNSSGILYDVLDLVAYSPSRIQVIANFTAKQIGNFNSSSLSGMSGLTSALNFSKIYNSVMDSGVVTSLLDGILLDEDYRPTLVKLISRLLEGNKNMFLYLVQDIFKKLNSKRDMLEKRATSSLETFVGNIIASALGSLLVGGISNDVLVALNETQFLTYTVKTLIGNEGYQNMTAQLLVDIIKTGDVKLDSQAINITQIADKALSNPAVIVGVVSQLLSGNINLGGMGKYSDAVGAIIKGVEDDGVFEDLNKYVFSESHTVTTPLIPTGNIVVPRTTTASTTGKSSLKSLGSSNRTSTSTSAPRTTSISSDDSSDSSDSESAAEVASILSVLGVSSGSGSGSSTTGLASSRRSSSGRSASRTTSNSRSGSSSSININDLLNQLSSSDSSETGSANLEDLIGSSSASSVSSNGNAILNLLAGLGLTQNRAAAASTSSAAASSSSLSAANGAPANNFVTKMLVYTHAVLLGGVLLL